MAYKAYNLGLLSCSSNHKRFQLADGGDLLYARFHLIEEARFILGDLNVCYECIQAEGDGFSLIGPANLRLGRKSLLNLPLQLRKVYFNPSRKDFVADHNACHGQGPANPHLGHLYWRPNCRHL